MFSVFLLAGFALVLSACGGLSQEEEHNNRGVELYEKGELNAAIREEVSSKSV